MRSLFLYHQIGASDQTILHPARKLLPINICMRNNFFFCRKEPDKEGEIYKIRKHKIDET